MQFNNFRKKNKWQTVHVGTFNECLEAQKHLSEILKIMHGAGYNQFLDDGSTAVKIRIGIDSDRHALLAAD